MLRRPPRRRVLVWLRRGLSSAEEETMAYVVPQSKRIEYKKKIHEQRRLWRAEELARAQTSTKEKEEEVRLRKEAKAAKLAAKREVALKNIAKEEEKRLAQEAIYRQGLRETLAKLEGYREVCLDRQRRLVAALEEESALWLTSEDLVDEKITDALWKAPGSTGLVTDASHYAYRYVLDFERVKHTPNIYADDPESLVPTPHDMERARVATTAERLIRTQATDLNEFFHLLEDADSIADDIKDVPIDEYKPPPRNYQQRRQQPRGGGGFRR